MHKAEILLILSSMLLSACGTNLWGTYDPEVTVTPSLVPVATATTDPQPTATAIQLPSATAPTATPIPTATATPTIQVTFTTPGVTRLYTSQPGDSLKAVALHFSVKIPEISASVSLPTTGLLNPNTLLIIPDNLGLIAKTPSLQIMPDSEVIYSPSAQSFDIEGYIDSAGGKLSTFNEYMATVGMISGAEGVKRIALGSSINPRMLLAFIQYYTGWVQGQPKAGVDDKYPLGYQNPQYTGLYQQLRLLVRELLAGYYGWRDGELTDLTFQDGSSLRIDPDLNAGTVALEYLFSQHLNKVDWLQAIDTENGFPAFYTNMFSDPWERAKEYGPLFPPDLTQPPFTLPFEVGVPWTLTGGPHPAWEAETTLGALDFAPPMDAPGCGESIDWVVAISAGQIVRSEGSFVVLDLDGDGFEQTGWVVLYQHIATKDRVKAGTWVNAGAYIGHPSCEPQGSATGTHVHIARKYNGEWVGAGDPLPFVLSGWTAHEGDIPYHGTLTKGDQVVIASDQSLRTSQIIRQPGE